MGDSFSCSNQYKDVNATFITGISKQMTRLKNTFTSIIEMALIKFNGGNILFMLLTLFYVPTLSQPLLLIDFFKKKKKALCKVTFPLWLEVLIIFCCEVISNAKASY